MCCPMMASANRLLWGIEMQGAKDLLSSKLLDNERTYCANSENIYQSLSDNSEESPNNVYAPGESEPAHLAARRLADNLVGTPGSIRTLSISTFVLLLVTLSRFSRDET